MTVQISPTPQIGQLVSVRNYDKSSTGVFIVKQVIERNGYITIRGLKLWILKVNSLRSQRLNKQQPSILLETKLLMINSFPQIWVYDVTVAYKALTLSV